jgi:hypothetical protein
VSVGTS